MTTRTVWQPWETAPSYEQFYAERRHELARLLEEWGVDSNNAWPDRAVVVRVERPKVSAHWATQLIEIGRRGIHTHVRSYHLQRVIDQVIDVPGTLDVYWIVPSYGTRTMSNRQVSGYVFAGDEVIVVTLGCSHDHVNRIVRGRLDINHCLDCGSTWEYDSSD